MTRSPRGVAEDFFEYEKEAFGEAVLGQKTKQMRTIPLNIRIKPEFHVGNYDDIRKIIDRSPGPFAVMNCVCKQAKDAIGHSCKKTDDRESCILLESGVQFAESLGVGKEISKKEVLNLVKKAKKDGLVLQPENTQQPHFICCCCGCCCGVLTAAKLYDKPSQFLHSNYFAEVDAAKCSLCETCLERCPMDALHQTDNHMEVNNDRCIGCGACIPTCPDHALALVQKENCYVPPTSTMEMYKNIMVERFGWTGTIKIAAKAALGMKV
ncbi:MAG: 4Fe-4S binding protein [Cyclobacteriaceae bacterium]|nr:4Fe-4S binding protein [Cyclobacteriaceae bacterium]